MRPEDLHLIVGLIPAEIQELKDRNMMSFKLIGAGAA